MSSNQQNDLKQFPWPRTPEKKAEDEELQLHDDGYCQGPPECWRCQEIKEDLEKLEKKEAADLHDKVWCDPIFCVHCHAEAEEEERKHQEERTRRANARAAEILDIFKNQSKFARLFKV